jgi:HEAT repeat protein
MMKNGRWRFALPCVCLLAGGCSDSTGDLIEQLASGDTATRRAAARALATQHGDVNRVVSSLLGALDDVDLDVRELAADSLGRIGPDAKSARPALEGALHDPEPSVRLAAARAIRRVDPHASSYQSVLIDALRAGDGTVFIEISRMGPEAEWAVTTLTVLLSDRRSQIRALAAQALGGIAPAAQDVQQALRRSLRDPEPAVRTAAQTALRQIEKPASTPVKTSR